MADPPNQPVSHPPVGAQAAFLPERRHFSYTDARKGLNGERLSDGRRAADTTTIHIDDRAAAALADEARRRLSSALIKTADGDHAAFREVYDLTSAKLFGICLRICRDRSSAEDVLHDVYLTIWKRAGNWVPGQSSPITWLATIARNRAIDWRRARANRATIAFDGWFDLTDPKPGPEAAALSSQQARQLQTCLDKLEVRQADAIRTAFFDGLTYSELALRSDVSVSTMKSRVRRGLAQLKLQLSRVTE